MQGVDEQQLRLGQVSMEQRMALFSMAWKSSKDQGSRAVVETFAEYLNGVVNGMLLPHAAFREPDLFDEFLADRCEFEEGGKVQSSKLYKAYIEWLQAHIDGAEVPSAVAFGKLASTRLTKKYSNVRYFLGVVLKKEEEGKEEELPKK